MLGMLSLALEELENPLYYVLDDICSVMHLETPNHNVIRYAKSENNKNYSKIFISQNSF
jgi:tRNA G26 N,N-dimethylase Trm1